MRVYSELVEMCRECPAFMMDAWENGTHGCSILPDKMFFIGTDFPAWCPLPQSAEYPDDKE